MKIWMKSRSITESKNQKVWKGRGRSEAQQRKKKWKLSRISISFWFPRTSIWSRFFKSLSIPWYPSVIKFNLKPRSSRQLLHRSNVCNSRYFFIKHDSHVTCFLIARLWRFIKLSWFRIKLHSKIKKIQLILQNFANISLKKFFSLVPPSHKASYFSTDEKNDESMYNIDLSVGNKKKWASTCSRNLCMIKKKKITEMSSNLSMTAAEMNEKQTLIIDSGLSHSQRQIPRAY